jgi:peptidoglycan hydrolase CwlO-like protein
MKTVLYLLALLVTAGAIFFSWDVHRKFQQEHGWINERYENKQTGEKSDTGLLGINERLKAEVETTNKQLKDERNGLDAAKKLLAERNAEIEVAESNERTLRRTLTEAEAKLEEQQAKLDELNRAVKKVQEILGSEGVTIEDLPNKIAEVRAQKKDLTDKLAELETLIDGAGKSVAKNQDEMKRLADRKVTRDSRIRRNTMEAAITGVSHEWGFVIVGAGTSSGFTPQTSVLVKRDGRVIARLKPTSIEPNQTIFEIDRDTLLPGVRLRPGDRVLLSEPQT